MFRTVSLFDIFLYEMFPTYSGNISQVHIIDQLYKFISQAHALDAKKSGKSAPRRDTKVVNQIKDSKGFCFALTVFVLYGLWLEDEIKLNKLDKGKSYDDWQWIKNVLQKLSAWDGDINNLSIADGEDIDRFINHIQFFQTEGYKLFNGQSEINFNLEDTKSRTLKHEYSIAGLFTEADFTNPNFLNIIQDRRLIFSLAQPDNDLGHAIGIYKRDDEIYVYDSGDYRGLKQFNINDPKAVKAFATFIHERHYFPEVGNPALGIMHYFDRVPSAFAFNMFHFGQPELGLYPTPQAVLAETEYLSSLPSLSSNMKSYLADNALIEATLNNADDSLKMYFQHSATFFSAPSHDKKKKALFRATYQGFTDSVQTILEQAINEKVPKHELVELIFSLLNYATYYCQNGIVKVLMNFVDTHLKDHKKEIFTNLLPVFFTINANGTLPVHSPSVWKKDLSKFIDMFITLGIIEAVLLKQDNYGRNFFHVLMGAGTVDEVTLLLKQIKNKDQLRMLVCCTDNDGNNVLHHEMSRRPLDPKKIINLIEVVQKVNPIVLGKLMTTGNKKNQTPIELLGEINSGEEAPVKMIFEALKKNKFLLGSFLNELKSNNPSCADKLKLIAVGEEPSTHPKNTRKGK